MKNALMKLGCVLLVVLMLGAMLMACADADKPDPKDTTTPTPTATDTPTPTEDEKQDVDYLLQVPQRTGDKKDFTILTRDLYRYEVFVAEEDLVGDMVEQAVFDRNNRVEEYMNVSIDYMEVSYTWQAMQQVISTVRESVMSGDGAFDLGSTYLAYSADMAVEGLFYNLMDLESFHSDSPWWVQGYVDNNIVYDRMYMVVGDMSLSMWQKMYVTFFNKNLAKNLGIDESLYADAKAGDWTMYDLMEYATQVAVDNGDDVWDDQDTYGLLVNAAILRAMATTCGVDLTERNSDGGYDLCMYNDHSVEVYAQIADWLTQEGVYLNKKTGGDVSATTPMFKEERALFFMATLDVSADLRAMDGDFGVLPMPKYDDAQTEYRAHSFDGFSVYDIPATHENPEFVASVMEALNAESKHSVIPKYYEVVLKDRTARDKESAEMMDVIRDALRFDFGYTHYTAMNYMLSYWGDTLANGTTSFTSVYESQSSSFESRLQILMEFYEGIY